VDTARRHRQATDAGSVLAPQTMTTTRSSGSGS
jgi:hypothetical protein